MHARDNASVGEVAHVHGAVFSAFAIDRVHGGAVGEYGVMIWGVRVVGELLADKVLTEEVLNVNLAHHTQPDFPDRILLVTVRAHVCPLLLCSVVW